MANTMLKHMSLATEEFKEYLPQEFETEIEEMRSFFQSRYLYKETSKMMRDYRKSLPVVIPTRFFYDSVRGKEAHIVYIFFYKTYLVIAEKALSDVPEGNYPGKIYHINSKKVTSEALKEVAALYNTSNNEFYAWLSSIKDKFNAVDVKLNPNQMYPFSPKQSVDNCAYENAEVSFHAFLTLLRRQTQSQSTNSFKRWKTYLKYFAIKNFFAKTSKTTLQNNPQLLDAVYKKVTETKWPKRIKKMLQPIRHKLESLR